MRLLLLPAVIHAVPACTHLHAVSWGRECVWRRRGGGGRPLKVLLPPPPGLVLGSDSEDFQRAACAALCFEGDDGELLDAVTARLQARLPPPHPATLPRPLAGTVTTSPPGLFNMCSPPPMHKPSISFAEPYLAPSVS